MIWSVLQVLLAQETDLLVGRHLDQLIICTIYGMCRVHPTAFIQQPGVERDINFLFRDITEAYTSANRKSSVPVGNKFSCFQTNVQWVLIEVLVDTVKQTKGDIIQFYNAVYLDRMKDYIIATKNMHLEQGARTPILNKSNFAALLTPGGRSSKPGIQEFVPMTPLIDEIESKRNSQQMIFSHTPVMVHQTPRTRQIYASERSLVPLPAVVLKQNVTSGFMNMINKKVVGAQKPVSTD